MQLHIEFIAAPHRAVPSLPAFFKRVFCFDNFAFFADGEEKRKTLALGLEKNRHK